MATTNGRVLRALNHLYRICRAGEKGFEVAAENVSNRGLKVLLKSFARQRAGFTDELEAEIARLGGRVGRRSSIRGILHRGWINIKAATTFGPENTEIVVLGEARRGERAAVNTYQVTLDEPLPAETRALVERQYEQVRAASDEVFRLAGRAGERTVVRLYDSAQDVEMAVGALERAGFAREAIEIQDFHHLVSDPRSSVKVSTLLETVSTAALGGFLIGALLGLVAGVVMGVILGMRPALAPTLPGTVATIMVGGAILGVVFGVVMGALIGMGIREEDTLLTEDSVQHGAILVRLRTDEERAMQASQILRQANVAAHVQGSEGTLGIEGT